MTVNPVLDVNQYPMPCPEDLMFSLTGGLRFIKTTEKGWGLKLNKSVTDRKTKIEELLQGRLVKKSVNAQRIGAQ